MSPLIFIKRIRYNISYSLYEVPYEVLYCVYFVRNLDLLIQITGACV